MDKPVQIEQKTHDQASDELFSYRDIHDALSKAIGGAEKADGHYLGEALKIVELCAAQMVEGRSTAIENEIYYILS